MPVRVCQRCRIVGRATASPLPDIPEGRCKKTRPTYIANARVQLLGPPHKTRKHQAASWRGCGRNAGSELVGREARSAVFALCLGLRRIVACATNPPNELRPLRIAPYRVGVPRYVTFIQPSACNATDKNTGCENNQEPNIGDSQVVFALGNILFVPMTKASDCIIRHNAKSSRTGYDKS